MIIGGVVYMTQYDNITYGLKKIGGFILSICYSSIFGSGDDDDRPAPPFRDSGYDHSNVFGTFRTSTAPGPVVAVTDDGDVQLADERSGGSAQPYYDTPFNPFTNQAGPSKPYGQVGSSESTPKARTTMSLPFGDESDPMGDEMAHYFSDALTTEEDKLLSELRNKGMSDNKI